MLSDLTTPLGPGGHPTLTLDFERNGTRQTDVEVIDWDEAVDSCGTSG
jgi:hypothetical protein